MEPGETFAEQFDLAVPLAPFTWYESRRLRSGPVRRPLYFELGYAQAPQPDESLIQPLETSQGRAYYANWFPLERQKIVATGPLAEVMVLSAR